MAGDWIKMRTDLYRDPKVCLMADILMHEDGDLASYISQHAQRDMTVTRNVMRNVTVGALVAVWGVARHQGKRIDNDLVIQNSDVWVIDDIADLPGFGQAMMSVEWVIKKDENLIFPSFFKEFNVEPGGDQRQKNAERQRRYREKNNGKSNDECNALRNVTVTSQSNDREEKRREEYKKDPPTPQRGDARFDRFWKMYPRKTAKPVALKSFQKLNPDDATLEAILRALEIQRGWEQWCKDDGKYIPHPAKWLNQRQWEDELPEISNAPPKPQKTTVIYDELPGVNR